MDACSRGCVASLRCYRRCYPAVQSLLFSLFRRCSVAVPSLFLRPSITEKCLSIQSITKVRHGFFCRENSECPPPSIPSPDCARVGVLVPSGRLLPWHTTLSCACRSRDLRVAPCDAYLLLQSGHTQEARCDQGHG